MVREIVYARFFGTSWFADAFIFAFMVPNLFRRLLGEGALTAAFIPIFKEKETKESEQEMWRAVHRQLDRHIRSRSAVPQLALLLLPLHGMVSEEVESELLHRSISDIAGVGRASLFT